MQLVEQLLEKNLEIEAMENKIKELKAEIQEAKNRINVIKSDMEPIAKDAQQELGEPGVKLWVYRDRFWAVDFNPNATGNYQDKISFVPAQPINVVSAASR